MIKLFLYLTGLAKFDKFCRASSMFYELKHLIDESKYAVEYFGDGLWVKIENIIIYVRGGNLIYRMACDDGYIGITQESVVFTDVQTFYQHLCELFTKIPKDINTNIVKSHGTSKYVTIQEFIDNSKEYVEFHKYTRPVIYPKVVYVKDVLGCNFDGVVYTIDENTIKCEYKSITLFYHTHDSLIVSNKTNPRIKDLADYLFPQSKIRELKLKQLIDEPS
jgi:hypothetical protein